jgi:hypothetical protein
MAQVEAGPRNASKLVEIMVVNLLARPELLWHLTARCGSWPKHDTERAAVAFANPAIARPSPKCYRHLVKPISDAKIIQIEITNACWLRCGNCTRLVGHHKKPYFMSLATVLEAIDSLEKYPGVVGIVGGEPTLHPDFARICGLLRERRPREKCVLFTSGHKWEEYKPIIWQTFGYGVFYNDHSDSAQCHQPVLVAIDEVIQDKELMWRLIDKCWVQNTWSASVTPNGAFFCEVAAALDTTFGLGGGYKVDGSWWKRTPTEFHDQVKKYCVLCSAALPMSRPFLKTSTDYVSPGNFERLTSIGSPKVSQGLVQIVTGPLDGQVPAQVRQWRPDRYLTSELRRKKNLRWDEIWLIRGFMGLRRRYIKLRRVAGFEKPVGATGRKQHGNDWI